MLADVTDINPCTVTNTAEAKVRDPSRSQPIAATLKQARQLVAEGYTEIVLTGINIGLFGQDLDADATLLDLIRALDGVDGLERIRISSIEPNLLTDEIINFVAESETFQPHFHLPLQSGDNDVLGAMRRGYQRDVYADRVAAIRERLPDAGIGCDVIVDFPAEDGTRFANSYIRVRRDADPQREGVIESVRFGALNEDGTVETEGAAFIPIDAYVR